VLHIANKNDDVYARRAKINKKQLPGAVPCPEDYIDDPVSLELFNRSNDTYQEDISKELFDHACSVYSTWGDKFPERFDVATHLDYFLILYKGQVYGLRHNTLNWSIVSMIDEVRYTYV
jgi:hypothetical protein